MRRFVRSLSTLRAFEDLALNVRSTTSMRDTVKGLDKQTIAELHYELVKQQRIELEKGATGEQEFVKADVDNTDSLTRAEFKSWYSMCRGFNQPDLSTDSRETPTVSQYSKLMIRSAVPYIAFGFVDNFIMIVAGSEIEQSAGVALGLTTMAAAGLGNLVSDVCGVGLGNTIENMGKRLGLPDAKLSAYQLNMRLSQMLASLACMLGIAIGCILGMFPLLLFKSSESSEKTLFGTLDTESTGKLTSYHVCIALRSLGHKIDEYQAKEFTSNRLGRSDNIDFEEFKQLLRAYPTVSVA